VCVNVASKRKKKEYTGSCPCLRPPPAAKTEAVGGGIQDQEAEAIVLANLHPAVNLGVAVSMR
jgi:hypothetical protein